MKIITDDIAVFNLLEKANIVSFDPAKPAVIEFLLDEDWCLLIFNPLENQKGCRLYLLENKLLNYELERSLLPELLSLDDNPDYNPLKNKALSIVEQMLREKSNSQLFFDGH